MTALAANIGIEVEFWKYRQFTLKAGQIAYKGGSAVIKLADGKVYPGPSATGYSHFLGVFAEQVDASSAGPLGSVDQPVNVDLLKERVVLWRANDGTITAANVGSNCYLSDDQTVSLNSTNQPLAGTILAVDTVLGVAFAVEGF
jgi:hypothetical protein